MEPFIGQIMMFGGNFAPRGWALCDGQLLPINQNAALFSILGTTYGGDGQSTFGLPDLRGRVAMHPGTGPGLSPRSLGQKSGVENVTLDINQMPSHSHTAALRANTNEGDAATPSSSVVIAKSGSGDPDFTTADPDTSMSSDSIVVFNNGGNQSHTNVQPFQCVNYIIALVGIFPTRN